MTHSSVNAFVAWTSRVMLRIGDALMAPADERVPEAWSGWGRSPGAWLPSKDEEFAAYGLRWDER